MREDENSDKQPVTLASYLLLALVLAVVVYVRIRLLTVPLERDEGEFAYMGQLLLKGIPPFSHAYTMKLPGVSVMYALFMFLFGQTAAGIHMGLLIVNGACIYLVYLLSRRLFDNNTALYSSASYAVLSLSSSVLGIFAHATHFVVLFALAGYVMLLRSIDNRRILPLFISGICFGLAVTMKQHAVLFLIFGALFFVWRIWTTSASDKKKSIAGLSLFLLGTIIPYAMIVLCMVTTGSFSKFWFWTVQYALEYTTTVQHLLGWHLFTYHFSNITVSQLPLWLFAGFGALLLGINKIHCADRPFVFGFLLFSFLSICPGLYFRHHYFVMLLPAVAMLTGVGTSSAGLLFSSSKLVRFAPFMTWSLLVLSITYTLYHERGICFVLKPLEASRALAGRSPFPEAVQIADYIKNNTSANEKIAVLGSEPEIFFYADRLSATGHIYMYGLMENQPHAERMQMQMIREIEAARPSYIVTVNIDVSWLAKDTSIRRIYTWGGSYTRDFYDQTGFIDIIDSTTTRYLWGDKALRYTPVSNSFLIVHKRKSGV